MKPSIRWVAIAIFATLAIGGNAFAANATYDGETLFRGIFFAQGPVADQFPEIWKDQQNIDFVEQMNTRQVRESATAFMAGMRAKDPTFFDRFASDIQSGNPVLVDDALQYAAKLGQTVGQELIEKANLPKNMSAAEKMRMIGRGRGDCGVTIIVTFAFAANIAVTVNIAAGANAVWNSNVFWDRNIDLTGSTPGKLGSDERTKRITERLAIP